MPPGSTGCNVQQWVLLLSVRNVHSAVCSSMYYNVWCNVVHWAMFLPLLCVTLSFLVVRRCSAPLAGKTQCEHKYFVCTPNDGGVAGRRWERNNWRVQAWANDAESALPEWMVRTSVSGEEHNSHWMPMRCCDSDGCVCVLSFLSLVHGASADSVWTVRPAYRWSSTTKMVGWLFTRIDSRARSPILSALLFLLSLKLIPFIQKTWSNAMLAHAWITKLTLSQSIPSLQHRSLSICEWRVTSGRCTLARIRDRTELNELAGWLAGCVHGWYRTMWRWQFAHISVLLCHIYIEMPAIWLTGQK